jgi:hypothetical protein
LFAGYTKESATGEGLQQFIVDDATWWVDRDGMSIDQEKRLKRILKDIRPWVANSVTEMRHCSPRLIQHIPHAKPDTQWKRWRGKKQISEKEIGKILQ